MLNVGTENMGSTDVPEQFQKNKLRANTKSTDSICAR